MKWKYLILLFIISFGSLIGMMMYYHLDWSLLASLSFYENLANPSIRIVRVQEGLRKEQIAEVMANKLGWDETETNDFINSPLAINNVNYEGHYFPKTYMLPKGDSPTDVTSTMLHEFGKETADIKKPKATQIINQNTALTIASIIQREAANKDDMRLISGIIWNRLFKGMKLQIDATLQYAKGTAEDGWWGQVNPKDKNLNSPYNTYLNGGLPPSPISNPGLAAIEAAYNPQKTSCLFYMHDKNRVIHCAATYEQHKKNIDRYY